MSHVLLVYRLIVWFSICRRSIGAKDVRDHTQTTTIRVNNTLALQRAKLLETMPDDVPEVQVNSTTASTAVRECKIPKVTAIPTREACWNETLVALTSSPTLSKLSAHIRIVSG
jgi:hypothetical protein